REQAACPFPQASSALACLAVTARPRIAGTSSERGRVAVASRVANRDRCEPGRRTKANGPRKTPRRTRLPPPLAGGRSVSSRGRWPAVIAGRCVIAQAEGSLPDLGAAEIGWHHDPRPEMGARVFACPRPEGASVTGAVAGIVRLEPVVRERMADLETPVSAFAKLRGLGGAFLLESAEGGERMGRYSFIGVAPREVIVSRDSDPLVRLRQAMAGYERAEGAGLPRFSGGAVGYVAYEAARHFERLPLASRDPHHAPDAVFGIYDTV